MNSQYYPHPGHAAPPCDPYVSHCTETVLVWPQNVATTAFVLILLAGMTLLMWQAYRAKPREGE